MKVLVQSGMFLEGSWGESWFDVLEASQNADYVLMACETDILDERVEGLWKQTIDAFVVLSSLIGTFLTSHIRYVIG